MVRICGWLGDGIMPIGSEKAGLMGAAGSGAASPNYFGDGSLGDCQFGASSITQTGDSTAIDTVLTTGSEAGGPGSSSYGTVVPNSSAVYETTVLSTSGSYDGDMWVGNFGSLTIDASVTLTPNQPCRGMFIFVDGDCTINGALSMSSRGGFSDPTASGGSDASAVGASGLQFGVFTSGGSSSFTNDGSGYDGAGSTVITALANMDNISSDGDIITIVKTGGAPVDNAGGTAGATGALTIGCGGGAAGRKSGPDSGSGNAGGYAGPFSSGSGRGGYWSNTGAARGGGQGGDYGAAGHRWSTGGSGGSGAGNPGAAAPAGGGTSGGDGNGGLIVLMVSGDLEIGSGGSIEAKGTAGGNTDPHGGGTGGGAIMVLYAGSLTNNGTIEALGGSNGSTIPGGTGGTHTLNIE